MDDVSEYRKQYEAELDQAAQGQESFRDMLQASHPKRSRNVGLAAGPTAVAVAADDADDLTAAMNVVRDSRAGAQLRSAALGVIGTNIEERPDLIDGLLDLLRDATLPVDQRVAVLNLLQQISFRFVTFPAKRPAFLEALRSIVDDPDADLRRRAIGVLAREKDEYVQRRLIEGLDGTAKALVPAAKAIQFLGYDVHAEHFPLLRRIVEDPPNQIAKKEAIRLLAADPSSTDLLLGILSDRSEKPDVRRISAIALQSMAPDKLQAEARRIVMTDDEDDQLRALALNTMTYFGNPATMSEDVELARHIDRLRAGSPSKQMKQATSAYLSKHST